MFKYCKNNVLKFFYGLILKYFFLYALTSLASAEEVRVLISLKKNLKL